MKNYFVYIMANRYNTVLYTGLTNDIAERVYNHKLGLGGRFTSKYRISKLVYYEVWSDIKAAIYREKQIKAGSRTKKVLLVESMNPDWVDLYNQF